MMLLWWMTLCLWSCTNGKVYIVDVTNGDDRNDGLTVSTAFNSIQKCVSKLENPGDECKVAKGWYHEDIEIDGLRGTAEKPFRITGLDDDRPVWDGTVPIEPKKWDFDKATGICSAAIEQDITALFLNGDLLTAARWPNALWSDRTCFNNSFWGKSDETSTRGKMVDDGTAGLAKSGINANGSMAILNIGSWDTFVGQVLHHEAGSNNFLYDDHFGDIHFIPKHNQYYFEASLSLLDAPEEWFYNMETKMLYLIPPVGSACPDPSLDTLRGRTVDYGLTISNTTGLSVSNMTFFACNVKATSFSKEYVDEITLESIAMVFASSSHRMLKSDKKPNWTQMGSSKSKDGKVSVINSTFLGGEGAALEYSGASAYIHNNIFAYNDWAGHNTETKSGGFGTLKGDAKEQQISQNTLWYNGYSAGIRPGEYANVSYNHVAGQGWGLISHDGAGMQFQPNTVPGAHVSHNWVRDSPKGSIRFDDGPYYGIHGILEFNVAWNTTGFKVKGDNHTVANNLAMEIYTGPNKEPSSNLCDLCVIYKFKDDRIYNNYIVVLNNGATLADGGGDWEHHTRYPLPGIVVDNNYSGGNVRENLVDSDNWDFRPLKNSNFTDGDIIGPYLPGVESFYWIPGRKLYKTSTPVPPSGSTVGSDRDVLMFLGAYRADYYHWFFGINDKNVENAEVGDDEYQGEIEEGNNVLELPQLKTSTDYYWRVDAQWGGYMYKGDLWNFHTNHTMNHY